MIKLPSPPALTRRGWTMDKDKVRAPSGQALVNEAAARLHPSGFDPSRWHKRCGDCMRIAKDDPRYFCVMNCSSVSNNEKAYF